MRLQGFEGLKDVMRQAKVVEPTADELQQKVKAAFKKAIDSMKEIGDRPELEVSKQFLVSYYQENGFEGMVDLLSKMTVLVDRDAFNYLIEINILKCQKKQ